jgi:hypothetical protein
MRIAVAEVVALRPELPMWGGVCGLTAGFGLQICAATGGCGLWPVFDVFFAQCFAIDYSCGQSG